MNIDFKNKKELTFLAFGILMLVIALVSMIFAIQFVISNINKVFDSRNTDGQNTAVKFQIEKAESLIK